MVGEMTVTAKRKGYLSELRNLLLALGFDTLPPGSLLSVQVAHDDWCMKLRGGVCTCEPVVRVVDLWPGGDTPASL